MRETDISAMKYRKSTHLSGLDIAEIITKKGKCILTIESAYYDKAVDVAGKKVDGYFIEFQGDLKPMMLNSINRKNIGKVVKMTKNISMSEAMMINNWVGQSIEFYFDETVKFGANETGGIRVKLVSPIPDISDFNALAILNESKALTELPVNWGKLSKQEQSLPSVFALKEKLKNTLK